MRRKFALSASAVLLAVWGAMGVGVSSAMADVTEVLPAESVAVIKFSHLDALNKKIGDFNTKLGIVAFKPEAADPLSMLLAEGQIKKESLDLTGDLAVAIVSGVKEGASPATTQEAPKEKPPIVVLIPISDYKAFLANFKDVKTDGDVSEFKGNKGGDEISYAAQWGKYAAISPHKSLVAKQGKGIKLPAFSAAQFAEKDVVMWGNIPALRADLLPKMEAHREEFLKDIEEGLKKSNQPGTEKFVPVARAFGGRLFDAAATFLKESDGSVLGASITDAGINVTIGSEFAKDSYIGKFASSVRPVEGSPTVGLPEGKYLMYGGGGSAEAFAPLVKDVLGPVVAELAKLEGGESVSKLFDGLLATVSSTKGSSFGLLAPSGGFGSEALFQVVQVIRGDAKGYASGMKAITMGMGPIVKAMVPQAAAQVPDFEVKDGFKTIDGVVVDRVAVKLNPNPATPEEAQMQSMQKMIYGPEGQFTDVAVLNEGLVIVGQSTTEANFKKLIASAKAGTDGPAALKAMAATRDQLPKSQSVVMYVALDEIVTTGVNYAKGFGMPINITLPPELPPIGVSLGGEGTVIRSDVHIPTALVQSLVAAGMQAYMQMQGGGGGMLLGK